MSLEIITNFLPITDDLDLFEKITIESNNNSVKIMAQSLQESYERLPKVDLSRKKAVITISATNDSSTMKITREYIII